MKFRFLLSTFLFISLFSFAQGVFEDPRSEVYNYLSRMAQKGLLIFDDNIRPLSRGYIESCLDSLQQKFNRLSKTEQQELLFYRQEFNDKRMLAIVSDSAATVPSVKADFFKKDRFGRWRAMVLQGNDFFLRADPILTAGYTRGTNLDIKQYSSGFNLYGYAGNHWSWYISFNDINEKGTGFDTIRQNTPGTGIVSRIASNKKSQNFSELRGAISYVWKNGAISFGQDYLTWGYGENGQMVLSAKAPTYPYVRLDYKPLPWLKFNYTHAWLSSNILDSNATYRTGNGAYGGIREIYVSKYMASHSLQITPWRGWDISLGESMIYSDRINIGYFIPILFFKAYDNLTNNGNINAGSNGQFFLQVSSRNNIRKTHLYSTLFIDELRVSTIFNPTKSRNQVGFNIGGSITDAFIPYLTLGAEYTRVNPFVYRNLIPAQNYTSNDYLLGDWMGNNSDRWIVYAKYTPLPRLKCMIRYQSIRKGGPGTVDQQYFQQPQPDFLFDLQNKRQEWLISTSYEWFNKLSLRGYLSHLRTQDHTSGRSYTERLLNIGITYGF